jgi:TusA-related sulfurtransferase
MPTTETLRVLDEMAAGEVLEVESDYYPAKSTIPYLCDERGYTYALSEDAEEEEKRGGSGQHLWRIRIQKA